MCHESAKLGDSFRFQHGLKLITELLCHSMRSENVLKFRSYAFGAKADAHSILRTKRTLPYSSRLIPLMAQSGIRMVKGLERTEKAV
jgi:hypothetical protein